MNADIILLDDFLPAVRAVAAAVDSAFLMVGASQNVRVGLSLELDEAPSAALRSGGRRRAVPRRDRDRLLRLPRGLFDPVPPFVVGRARFDNWLVWQARQRGVVVDASARWSPCIRSTTTPTSTGGLAEAHFGAEAERNLELAGGKRRLYTIYDASHRLTGRHVRRNLGASGRARENARKIAWKLAPR